MAFAVMLFSGPGVEPAAVNGAWFIPPVLMIIVPMVLVPFAGSVGAGDLGAFTALTVAVARAWHAGPIEDLGAILFLGLAAAWLIVAAGTLRAVRSGAAWAPASPPAIRPVARS